MPILGQPVGGEEGPAWGLTSKVTTRHDCTGRWLELLPQPVEPSGFTLMHSGSSGVQAAFVGSFLC